MLAQQLRTPRERTLFAISVVVSSLVWLVVIVSLVGILYAAAIGVVVLIAHALFLAHVTGNGVKLGPDQLPHLYQKVVAAARKLGLAEVPEVYLLEAGEVLNAFATKLLRRRFVILLSDLVDACEQAARGEGGEPDELDFVIAHEIGHLAAGHLTWGLLLLPARAVPWLGPAYSRACEYTCDACGHVVVGDLETSSRALALLAAGGSQARRMNLDAFVDQRRDTGRFWMAVFELNASHPYLSKRVAALRERERPGAAPAVGRNPFAYPLAPVFALSSGGGAAAALAVVAMIGVLAAAAIPSLLRSRMMANEAAAIGVLRTLAGAQTDYVNVAAPHRYAPSLAVLGSGTDIPFIDANLASGQKSGYEFALEVAPAADGDNAEVGWWSTATPMAHGTTGLRSFYIDQTAIVRGADLGGLPAGPGDPPVE
ncbi:MAG: M48 family metallopeptidase [Candidatus Schekmanbacteria bacterium]|nr:M48 family metallopeptidase [Candidatus Schekmanbacteria bacterium]